MHILLVTHYYEPEIGAPQRRWSALVERLVSHGHSVTILCPSPHYPDGPSTSDLRTADNKPWSTQQGQFGETIHRMPYLLHGYSGIARAIDQVVTATASIGFSVKLAAGRKVAHEGAFDVVISTVPGLPSLLAGTIISKVLGTAHVAEMRDAWPDVITGDVENQTQRVSRPLWWAKWTTMKLVTAGQKNADAVVVTTEWFAQVLRGRGVDNVHVVLNGAEYRDFFDLKPLDNSQVKRGQLRVQYLGTVGRSQGLGILIDALEHLKRTRPDVEITTRIVGEGSEIPALKQKVQDAGVQVEFLGTIPREQLVDAYQWADVELVTLRKTKPFRWTIPSKIFELLATQRRIVAAVEGSAAAVVQESGVGSVVEPENALALAAELERLADHPQELLTSTSGVQLLCSKYSYSRMAYKYENLLKNLVEARRLSREAGDYKLSATAPTDTAASHPLEHKSSNLSRKKAEAL